LVKVTLKRNLQ